MDHDEDDYSLMDDPAICSASTGLSDEDKLRAMVAYLTRSHLDHDGGYPYDYEWFEEDGTLAIASLDLGRGPGGGQATSLEVYSRRELLSWYDRAAVVYLDHLPCVEDYAHPEDYHDPTPADRAFAMIEALGVATDDEDGDEDGDEED